LKKGDSRRSSTLKIRIREVESERGKKDYDKVGRFVEEARAG